jgi:hypothetical protein
MNPSTVSRFKMLMLNAVAGGVAGTFTGAVSGWAMSVYFRTQDRLEAERIR